MELVFVDLETTGGVVSQDRITEIAIVRCCEGKEVSRWSSLINPEQKLTPFIRNLTGLTDQELARAPLFVELADLIEQKLEGAIFVAHNARFDYGFLKQEFARAGRSWHSANLCSVKLSRRFYPEHQKHGLDQLIERYQLVCEQRHRAMGDAVATLRFYQHLLTEFGEFAVEQKVEQLIQRPQLPENLAPDVLDDLPTTPGVYLLKDGQGEVLYCGYDKNIYQGVSNYLQKVPAPTWHQEITQIEYLQSAGGISAQLQAWQIMDSQAIKHQKGNSENYCSIELNPNSQGALCCSFQQSIALNRVEQCYGLFRNEPEAHKALSSIAKGNCLPLLWVDQLLPTEWQEEIPVYNLKLQTALRGLKLKKWPFDGAIMLTEIGDFTGLTEHHFFNQWCYLGSVNGEVSQEDIQRFQQEREQALCFRKPYYQLLKKLLADPKSAESIELLDKK